MPPDATDVLVVTGDPAWPPHHGGRVRVTRMVEALRARLAVCVAAPLEAPPPDGVAVENLPPARPVSRFDAMVTSRPRLGRTLLGRDRIAALEGVLARRRPRAVLFVNGYVAACGPALAVPTAIDFHDVDVARMASLARHGSPRARAANGLEAVKARWWEPRVARSAAVVSAATLDDVRTLAAWGARAVHVPNAVDRFAPSVSPPRGPVTLVASLSYAPNRLAAEWVLDEVWPRLRDAEPDLPLRLVGRRARQVLAGRRLDGRIEVVSDPPSIDRYYEQASLVLAPVRAGGGSQLKVSEALARGRVLVATPLSARSVPPPMRAGAVVADDAASFAAHVVRLWRDVAARRDREEAIAAAGARALPTWPQAWAPLVDALEGLVRPR